ncbi:MAG TPA: cob(I)yrinic acid a,c-diamide adenosyltransferase [Phycisphaerae bacterium]|nr:cob(I)yrinic acid a,c-diamide adenosyltransferase [Phycisphaerae bacterium]
MADRARILLFTGDGKGKTTAALGMVLRSFGHGIPAFVVQFIKGEEVTGELAAARDLANVLIAQVGLGFVRGADDPRFAEHKAAAADGLRRAELAIACGAYPVVVLDEVCLAVQLGLLDEQAVTDAVRKAGPAMTIVMTGRGATQGLIDLADTVTEMRCVKHGFDDGINAREGVEF